jgi:hypothetical protein
MLETTENLNTQKKDIQNMNKIVSWLWLF